MRLAPLPRGGGGGQHAYKADARKPKGLLVIGSLSLRFAVIVITFADQR